MSRADGCRCQQKHSDAASSREEVVSLGCSRTKNLPEMPSQGACRIIHSIQWKHPSLLAGALACPAPPQGGTGFTVMLTLKGKPTQSTTVT